jgi:1-acyl-sn-glycerol-3-phosphate acyltransferase
MRTIVAVVVSGLFVAFASVAILPVAVVTLFRARRVYAAITSHVARALLWFWGVRVQRHGSLPAASSQVVYVSNHSSTLDLFVLVALGLPNTRFFLSGFLQTFLPLAVLARLMGTFFTVPQDRPEERRRIFSRACRILQRTRESVYLSPEGGRITTGEIGPFNKGAFHLATALRAPMVPLYVLIPSRIDPGMGFNVRPGVVDVFIKPSLDTSEWRLEDVTANRERVRHLFVQWHREARDLRNAQRSSSRGVQAAPAGA